MSSMANQRILRATPATLSWQPQDSDGEVATVDPGTVTVGVVRADGSELVAAGAATSGATTNPRTYALTAAQTADLDILTATWTAAGVVLATTLHEVVGGFLFSLAEARGVEKSLADTSADPNAAVRRARDEVEAMFEGVCGRAFVPRFDTTRLDGCGYRANLSRPDIRRIRWVRQYSDYTTPTYTDYSVAEVAQANAAGFDGPWATLPYTVGGFLSVLVGFEHGMSSPPADIKRAALTAVRSQVNLHRSGVNDRAVSITTPDGTTQQLGRVGTQWRPTGIDSVDEVLHRYELRGPLVA